MKKVLVIVTISLLCSNIFALNIKQFEKRTVSILPVYNLSHDDEYDYLSDMLYDALRSALVSTDNFTIKDQRETLVVLDDNEVAFDKFHWESKIIEIGDTLDSNVVVYGFFLVRNDMISIYFNAIDMFGKKSAVTIEKSIDTGLAMLDGINKTAGEMAGFMTKKLMPYKKKLFTPFNMAGMSLTIAGGTLFLVGLPILIYDLTGYKVLLDEKLDTSLPGAYEEYKQMHNTYVGLFAFSLTFLIVGVALPAAGIPLLVYKGNKKKVALQARYNDGINLAVQISL